MPHPAREYLSADQDNPWMGQWADRWIRSKETDSEGADANDIEINLYLAEPDAVLGLIMAIIKRTQNGWAHDPVFSAGLLENFVSRFGADYIEVIEELARESVRLRHLLGGVWKSRTPDEIWVRIERIRGAPW